MNGRCPLPARASFRDLLRDLLGRPVSVRPGSPQELNAGAPSYLASFHFDDGVPAAVAVAGQSLSAAVAAALAMLPPKETLTQVEIDGGLNQEMVEFLHEVVNVTAKLLNSPTTAHVVLRQVLPVPGEVQADVAKLALAPSVRHDWQVQVEGYGEGVLTFLS